MKIEHTSWCQRCQTEVPDSRMNTVGREFKGHEHVCDNCLRREDYVYHR